MSNEINSFQLILVAILLAVTLPIFLLLVIIGIPSIIGFLFGKTASLVAFVVAYFGVIVWGIRQHRKGFRD